MLKVDDCKMYIKKWIFKISWNFVDMVSLKSEVKVGDGTWHTVFIGWSIEYLNCDVMLKLYQNTHCATLKALF